jgi:4-hydroxybenzoyl-CoA reductase subunit beta
VPINDFFLSDGIYNKKLEPGEILVEVRVPAAAPGHRGAYGKLRDRGSIDFPLLGVAVRLDLDREGRDGTVSDVDIVLTALQARPLRVKRAGEILRGTRPGEAGFDAAVLEAAAQAYKQCHPMPNIPGDAEYRREMVPVYVRRTLHAAASGSGPVPPT